ncbi:MAG TPA: hypothetical protein VFV66_04280 [Nonomuraea sp.]|nr:hypothetical protein [Nonomuraea sp.]
MAGAEIRLVRAESLAPCPPVPSRGQHPTVERVDRMARFAAGARRLVVRAVAIGALMAAGWLLAVLFGMLTAGPAAADAGSPQMLTPQALAGSGPAMASDNAQAMAGRTVDGLNSQRDPGLPAPSGTGKKILDTGGLVPTGGGSGPFGAAAGDVARSVLDPRLQARRAPLAYVLPPVVRTAADDPSFSPD